MRPFVRLAAVAVAALAVAAAAPPSTESAGLTHLKMIVGLTDDTAKWTHRSNRLVDVYKDLRLMAVRMTVPWRPGDVRPRPIQRLYLRRIARVAQMGERVVLAVYNTAGRAPVDARSRREYCDFLVNASARIPQLNDFEIWNEANSPYFWPQRSGAFAYEALLARCWSRLHAVHPSVNVISSTAAHHDPAGFILELGDAYRESGRTKRIFDRFGHNPYPDNSAEAPWATHEGTTTLAQGDYARLMDVLETAFGGTGQPVPRGNALDGVTLWYVEDGFQTVPPRARMRYYHGRETDKYSLPAVASDHRHGERPPDQVTQLRDAIELAYCQPAVTAFLNFELIDEDRLAGWQSGLLWRDGTRKPSYDAFKTSIADVRHRDIDCALASTAPR